MFSYFKDKSVLITGCCGSVGKELISQLANFNKNKPLEIIGIDNNESALFFQDQDYINDERIRFFVADIRNSDDLRKHLVGVDVVFHCAALKHVVLCERSPDQALSTNINGVQNIIAMSQQAGVQKVIFTSSDKAVNPTNVMGTTKLLGEKLITAANSNKLPTKTIFASTRFGNVLGSSGSVIPIFHNQISLGGPVTLTDKNMTRFVMSIEESVRLIIQSATLAKGGEVFITKMPVILIKDLAKTMIAELAPRYGFNPNSIEIDEIGIKPGEKLYEELVSSEEVRRVIQQDEYYILLPAFSGMYEHVEYDYPKVKTTPLKSPYISCVDNAIDVESVRNLLHKNKLLNKPTIDKHRRYWPGDKEEKN